MFCVLIYRVDTMKAHLTVWLGEPSVDLSFCFVGQGIEVDLFDHGQQTVGARR